MTSVRVAVPARDMWHAPMGFSLCQAMTYFAERMAPKGYKIDLVVSQGTLLPDMRAGLAKDAVKDGIDYLLFVDSDMRFPKDAIMALLARCLNGDPIVGAAYAQRKAPCKPTAMSPDGEWVFTKPHRYEGGELLEEGSTGLELVDFCGAGLLMISTKVFKALPEPWYSLTWVPHLESHLGEDLYFCRKAREYGFPTRIDHDLSQDVYHVGEFEYHHRHSWANKDMIEQQHQEAKQERLGRIAEMLNGKPPTEENIKELMQ